MIRMNENYNRLQGSYLFAEIAKRVSAYQSAHPGEKVIRLGIGDVTEPLAPSVIRGLHEAVDEMSRRETFKGYRSDEGYEFLREAIRKTDFLARGVDISIDEIVISTGAKEDTGNFQEIFADDIKIALPDPVYTVYVESNVMPAEAAISRTADTKTSFISTAKPRTISCRTCRKRRGT
jgi:LL-diaminopimelate aminotransferase